MPIIYTNGQDQAIQVGVWNINESLEYLVDQISLTDEELEGTDRLHTKLRKQWYACRHCIHSMIENKEELQCLKDEYGKPYLYPSTLYISLSHSYQMAAASISASKNGVDVQKMTNKVERVKKKFLHPKELNAISSKEALLPLHIYWGAKESIYKAHGRKRINFARDIRIMSFPENQSEGKTVGILTTSSNIYSYQIEWICIENYVLVHARQLL